MQQAKLHHYTVWFDNSDEYHRLKGEVFTQDSYYFETDNPQPVIIDAGAHIGLATLYFKKLYPGSKIIAIEPNPETFKLLEKNVWENQLEDVKLHQTALSTQSGSAPFHVDSSSEQWLSTSGFTKGAWNRIQSSQEITVYTQTLKSFLDQPIDFLKMDIEGAEQEVLMAAGEAIRQIKHMIIEFHPTGNQSLAKVIERLKEHRFTVTLWKDGKETDHAHAKGLILLEAMTP